MPEHQSQLPQVSRPRSETTERLRLLIVSQQFPSFAKPTHALYNKQQFQALSERFDIKVLVPVDWVSWLRHGRRALSGDVPLDIRYIPYFYFPKMLRWLTPRLMRLSIRGLFHRLLQWQPDAVMASWGYPDAPAVWQLLRGKEIPFFCTVHGSDVNLHCLVPSRRRQVVATFNSAEAVFSVSAALKSRLVSFGVEPDRVTVNYNGVDDKKFFPINRSSARQALSLSDDNDIFLFVGNIKEPKGPFDLLAAFQHLADQGRLDNTTLIYIGQGDGQHHLTQLAEQLEASCPGCRVMILGSLPHEQLNQWMNAADFVCLPSHSEGVPNVILESMRCGVPVIASDVGGIPEVLDARCGVLVPAKDIEAIANGIETARDTEWNPEEIRAYSQRFQWGGHVEFVHQLILSATGRTQDDTHPAGPLSLAAQETPRHQPSVGADPTGAEKIRAMGERH